MAFSMLAACLSFMISDNHSARPAVIALFIFIFFFFYSWGQGELPRSVMASMQEPTEFTGPVAFAYSSEIFPLLNREQGMSFAGERTLFHMQKQKLMLAVFINLFGAGLLTLFVPQLTKALQYGSSFVGNGQSRLLGIFAGLNVLSFLLIFFLVPETAGATLGKEEGSLNYISLEELNYIFGVSTGEHIDYQMNHMVPWALRQVRWGFGRYILRKDVSEPGPPEELYRWVNLKNLGKKEKRRRDGMPQNDENLSQEHQQLASKDSLEISSSG